MRRQQHHSPLQGEQRSRAATTYPPVERCADMFPESPARPVRRIKPSRRADAHLRQSISYSGSLTCFNTSDPTPWGCTKSIPEAPTHSQSVPGGGDLLVVRNRQVDAPSR